MVAAAAGSATSSAPSTHRHAYCTGRVWHVRNAPFRHAFDYRVRMLELDLDDLPGAFAAHPLWSLDRANLGSFRRRDHLDGSMDLAESARSAVADRLGFRPPGPVHLVCHPRCFGYAFNPVTFYLLYDSDPAAPGAAAGHSRGAHELMAILLEVSNTPWNERHLYALDCRGGAGSWTFELDKAFHVSPFLPMDMRYRFRFVIDDRRLEVIKENMQGERSVFVARMTLDRRSLTTRHLTRLLLAFPPMTFRVIGAIYWQALRLWLRGARYHPKPATNMAGEQNV
ncbi:MAG: DUF1365 domain-containing protein [Pseudomonadales bacterium]|nr:DUF1365 domain-containing protein [Pseudomonadales bacterium]